MAEVCPVAARLDNTARGLPTNDIWAYIGAIVMILGIILESAADVQKSAAKKVNPNRFVSTGLYKIVRCPNYFGEIVMWTGCLLVCIGATCNWWQWLISALGYITIVYIMFSGARRLEIRQNANYGDNPEYQAYVKKTPILIPLLPIYSVAHTKTPKAIAAAMPPALSWAVHHQYRKRCSSVYDPSARSSNYMTRATPKGR